MVGSLPVVGVVVTLLRASVVAEPGQILPVSIATRHGAGDAVNEVEPLLERASLEAIEGEFSEVATLHHASRGDQLLGEFELRFDEDDALGAGAKPHRERVQHGPGRSKGDIDGEEVERAGCLLEGEELEVGSLDEGYAGVGAERLAHLIVTDIDTGHVGGTGAQHDGGEAAVRAAHIDSAQSA